VATEAGGGAPTRSVVEQLRVLRERCEAGQYVYWETSETLPGHTTIRQSEAPEVPLLLAEIDRLAEALRYYTRFQNEGQVAREALAALERKPSSA
jgi:hypothetical protein